MSPTRQARQARQARATAVMFTAIAAAFSAFHVVRALLTLPASSTPTLTMLGAALYAALTILALTPWPRVAGRASLPLTVALSAVIGSALVTLAVTAGLTPDEATTHATWHVSAVGTLMVIVLVRGHEVLAWLGTLILVVESLIWVGLGTAVTMGITGSIIWVAGASVLTHALSRLARDSARLQRDERRSALWHAEREAHREERLERLSAAERRASPMLREILLASGNLAAPTRAEAVLLEAGMRDEIRGRALLSDAVRTEALAARRRGVDVRLFDEGGIDSLTPERCAAIHAEIADALAQMEAGQIIVRTVQSPDSPIAVTVVGLGPDEHTGELDVVVRQSHLRDAE